MATTSPYKNWEDLTISDDYMFKLVMRRKRICKKMLERILKVKIFDITYLETEKSMTATPDSKGIRLDVYVEDDQHTVYNVEMQVRQLQGSALQKRARYYQSTIDTDLLLAGYSYDELNKVIIIFICPFDPFGLGRHIYTFRNYCQEDKDLELGDGATKIFLNSKGTMNDVDNKVKAFLDYVEGILSDDDLVQEMEQEIEQVKKIEQERMSYMTFVARMTEERNEGRREGRREGIREGETNAILKMLQSHMPMRDIAQIMQWPVDKIHEIAVANKIPITD